MEGLTAVVLALVVAAGIAGVVVVLDRMLPSSSEGRPAPTPSGGAQAKATPAADLPGAREPVMVPPTASDYDPDEEITIVGFAPITLDDQTSADWADSEVIEEQDLGQTHPIAHDAIAADDEPTAAHALILVSAVGQTHRGRRRSNNQDAYAVLHPHNLFIVADGMGGYAGGEVASQLSVETMEQAFEGNDFRGNFPADLHRDGAQVAAAIQMANRAVWDKAQAEKDLEGMGTTVVAARFSPFRERIYIGHVGDSRCYRWRDGALVQLTTDHNLKNMGIKGRNSHMLTRAVGIGPGVEVDLIMAKPEAGDTYILCSDGLNKMVSDETIGEVLSGEGTTEDKVEELVNLANAAGGKDNITVILVEVAPP